MIKFDQWYFPDGEKHLQEWMSVTGKRVDGRLTYQYHKYAAALEHVKQRRVAIDVGAHVGLWSYFMAKDFEDVAAFEPMQTHQECWYKNMQGVNNAELFPIALGENDAYVAIETRTEGSSGDTGVVGKGDIRQMPLDDFKLSNVDLIKIDTEGYELDVLRGATDTLMMWKPCVIVEQKGKMIERYGHRQKEAVTFLETLGAKVRKEISGDFILSWDEAGTGRKPEIVD